MKGYHTGGDWSDITSIHRNEVVFEGRHQAYGAFFIRKRYPNALLLSLFSSVMFVAVCAFVPYALLNFIHHEIQELKPDIVTIINPVIAVSPITPIKKMPPVVPPKTNVSKDLPPIIEKKRTDSTEKELPKPIVPETSSGKGAEIPDPNPGSSGGGIAPPVPPVPPVSTDPPVIISQMPVFPLGSVSDYFRKHIEYPNMEREIGVSGTVYASFVVEADGSVTHVKILRGVEGGPGLEDEAKRVISGMPKWIPGKQNGNPARVQFSVPICFKLQ